MQIVQAVLLWQNSPGIDYTLYGGKEDGKDGGAGVDSSETSKTDKKLRSSHASITDTRETNSVGRHLYRFSRFFIRGTIRFQAERNRNGIFI